MGKVIDLSKWREKAKLGTVFARNRTPLYADYMQDKGTDLALQSVVIDEKLKRIQRLLDELKKWRG